MFPWDILLSATLEAGLGLLAEVGFGDEARALKERLTGRAAKERRAAFDRAFDRAARAGGENSLRPLLDHQPFREAVVAGLLDSLQGFDLQSAADAWGEQLPAHALALRRFFSTLENALLAGEVWGPVLERYQALRFRKDVLAALQARQLDVASRELVSALNVQLARDGAIALGDGATAIGAGGTQTVVQGDVLGDIVHNVINELKVEVTAPRTSPQPDTLRAAYLHRLFKTTRRLSLAGVDPKAASSEAEARLNLDSVYTALLTLTPKAHERLMKGEMADPDREARRLSALAQLDRHQYLVLMGDPGSGKTTFVNVVALCLAGEALGRQDVNLAWLTAPLPDDEGQDRESSEPWSHGALLPIRIILRDFAARGLPPSGQNGTADCLWQFIVEDLTSASLSDYAPLLRRELLEQGGLLLLDGLDEVPAAGHRREQIKQAVEDFAATYPRCRVLVTSRTYAYQRQDWRLPDFAETVLAPFSQGQICHFVERWYAHIAVLRGLHDEDAQGRAVLLQRAILGSERLRGLAERPLLLTLMASLHAWRGGSLPEKREELYADTVDLLLDWWESPKTVRDARGQVVVLQPSLGEWLKVDRDKVRDLLNELAYQAHAAQLDLVGTADVPEGDLVCGLMRVSDNRDVKQARLVEFLSQRAGLLLPRGVGVYTFPHRTFQEYLAACHLTDQDYPDLVAGLARKEPNRWREVALLAGAKAARGTASAVWSLVDALCYEQSAPAEEQAEADAWGALLAGQALVESVDLAQVSQRNRPKVERVRQRLAALLDKGRLTPVERAAAGRALGRLGDPRPGVGVDAETGLPDIAWCEVPAGSFLMGSLDNSLAFIGKETPQHKGRLASFRISQYPVTRAQYSAFVAAGGYEGRGYWTGKGWQWKEKEKWHGPRDFGEPFSLPNHPVVGVSWYEAVAFTRWLAEQLRKVGKLGLGEEVRLPTEAEWEKAARGTEGRIYPWDDKFDADRCNMVETGIGATSAVGAFPAGASPYGVQDLSGNVWEWCGTKFRNSYRDPADESLEGDARRGVRGGSFGKLEGDVRCAYRLNDYPHARRRYVGFRCVVSPGE